MLFSVSSTEKLSPFSTAYLSVFKLTLRPFQHILYIFIYTTYYVCSFITYIFTYFQIYIYNIFTHLFTYIRYIYIYILYIDM